MSKIPALSMERLALGELAADEARRVREGLGACAEAELAALRADDARLLSAHPVEVIAPRIRQRAESLSVRPPRALVVWLMPVLAGAAALAIALKVGVTEDVRPQREEGIRIKGDPTLVLRLQTPDGQTTTIARDTLVGKGDVVQLSVRGDATRRFGAVVSIDGRGHVTRHLPEEGSLAATLAAKEQALPHAYELDDAPDFERFVFVTAKTGFDVEVVLSALRALPAEVAHSQPLALPAGLSQKSVVLQKKERR